MQSVHINGREIPKEAIAAEAQNHPAVSPDAAWNAAAEALVVRELLLSEARRRGLEPEKLYDAKGRRLAEEDALIETLLTSEVRVPEADEATCRRYYENNGARFRSPDLYEAAHILFAADPGDKAAYADALGKAQKVLADLEDRPQNFAFLAQTLSDCPSAAQGGSLGQVGKGDTVPEFETFLFEMEEGQICPVPVKSRYGVHVIRLDRKIAGRTVPFEAVADKIADYLAEASWRRAASQYIRILAGQAEIAGLDFDAAESPLVQ